MRGPGVPGVPDRDTAASENRAKSAWYGASHANNEGMDFNSAPAVSKELKAQCFVLLTFFDGALVDVCVRRASYFKEQNAVMGALGRRPSCKSPGTNGGRDVRKENYVRAGGGVR